MAALRHTHPKRSKTTVHKPSRPEDLEHPDRIWARALTFFLLDASCGGETSGFSEKWMEFSTGAGWWWVERFDGDRAMFAGGASRGNNTPADGRQIDLISGGPDWLPKELLREEAGRDGIGFLYWWEDDAWHRVPYPEELREDHLDVAAPWLNSEEEFHGQAEDLLQYEYMTVAQVEVLEAECTRFRELAERRAVDEAAVTGLLAAAWPEGTEGMDPEHLPACLDLAARAGVTGSPARA
ncbi:hypothetical protein ACFVGY_14690 [Streptomyces sp. NPDC127106]|uniref:hypothetical protein n=1 Tax=Streptomyces sp. NPDC127106 TaxID=3345360 RepID=UPI0036285F91